MSVFLEWNGDIVEMWPWKLVLQSREQRGMPQSQPGAYILLELDQHSLLIMLVASVLQPACSTSLEAVRGIQHSRWQANRLTRTYHHNALFEAFVGVNWINFVCA